MAEVKTAGLLPASIERLKKKQAAHIKKRAERLSELALELHVNAPRGGENLNRHGEPRSAPGEPPAPEEYGLFMRILNGVLVKGDGRTVEVTVNTKFPNSDKSLETGTRTIAPRPLGRISLAKLKAEIR